MQHYTRKWTKYAERMSFGEEGLACVNMSAQRKLRVERPILFCSTYCEPPSPVMGKGGGGGGGWCCLVILLYI